MVPVESLPVGASSASCVPAEPEEPAVDEVWAGFEVGADVGFAEVPVVPVVVAVAPDAPVVPVASEEPVGGADAPVGAGEALVDWAELDGAAADGGGVGVLLDAVPGDPLEHPAASNTASIKAAGAGNDVLRWVMSCSSLSIQHRTMRPYLQDSCESRVPHRRE